jgi:DNA-binding GntR family transcriptional regulator
MIKAAAPIETEGRRSLGAVAYETIYRKIITLEYEPGRRLEENQLVDDLAIGRTPVREALQRLATDLLVETLPGKGFIVRPLTLQNTKAAFAALQILELGVASLAVKQDVHPCLEQMTAANAKVSAAMEAMDIYRLVEANAVFHEWFARCSENIYLIQSLQKVRCETNRLAFLSYGNEIDPRRKLRQHYTSVIRQHEQIVDALNRRDAEALDKIIVKHIGIFKNRIIRYMASF